MLLTEVQMLFSSCISKRRFLWIASDTWSSYYDTKYRDITIGKWGTAPYAETVPSFDDYYSQLTPAINLQNLWFTEFYERYYNCRFGVIVVIKASQMTPFINKIFMIHLLLMLFIV